MPSMQNTAIDPQSRPALAARARLQVDPVDGAPVLLYPEGLLQLNETARDVLSRCDGRTTIDEIVAALSTEYEASAEALRGDVLDCLAEFHRRQLLVFAA